MYLDLLIFGNKKYYPYQIYVIHNRCKYILGDVYIHVKIVKNSFTYYHMNIGPNVVFQESS